MPAKLKNKYSTKEAMTEVLLKSPFYITQYDLKTWMSPQLWIF